MGSAEKRKSSGRPQEVEGGERTSVLLGRQELRILAAAERHRLGHHNSASRSRVVRQLIRAAWQEREEELREVVRLEMVVEALQRELQKTQARLEAVEAQAAKPRPGKPTGMRSLLQHMRLVEERAHVNSALGSGIQLLDQVWLNSARSWPRVLEKLRALEAKPC